MHEGMHKGRREHLSCVSLHWCRCHRVHLNSNSLTPAFHRMRYLRQKMSL
jgi:hypothetical protein